MKEKTFEELIQESKIFQDKNGYYFIQTNTVLKLMQQVREATIAECRKIALDEDDSVLIWDHIKKMPTDRIKTDL